MSRIPYEQLLRVPFLAGGNDPHNGLDCVGQARWIGELLGLRVPPVEFREGSWLGELMYLGNSWRHAKALGDIIVSSETDGGPPTHVSTVVGLNPTWILSASSDAGPFAAPAWSVSHQIGAYRIPA